MAPSLLHHNFATLRHSVIRFPAECSERDCSYDKDQCFNTAVEFIHCFAAGRSTVQKQY